MKTDKDSKAATGELVAREKAEKFWIKHHKLAEPFKPEMCFCPKCKSKLKTWDDYGQSVVQVKSSPEDKRYAYKTAWTLVGGYAFTSNQCVAVRYIGLGQYRINETGETLHECHLTDFCL